MFFQPSFAYSGFLVISASFFLAGQSPGKTAQFLVTLIEIFVIRVNISFCRGGQRFDSQINSRHFPGSRKLFNLYLCTAERYEILSG